MSADDANLKPEELLEDARRRMIQAVDFFRAALKGMRTGRPSPELLEDVQVDCYGSSMPLKQVASITVEEGRTLAVQVWDKDLVTSVDRTIRLLPMGLNPESAGTTLHIKMPSLSEEMRRNLVKQAKSEAEKARISVRNVRRDVIARYKSAEAAKDMHTSFNAQVQKLTDEQIEGIDRQLGEKESLLMQA
ncbi:MAG: ribosome recycling factor [Gammaproteobacteria bacterium]